MIKLKVPVSESKYIGAEPVWDGPATQTQMVHAYTWYRAVLDVKSARAIIEEYMRWKSFSSHDIEAIAHVEDAWFDTSNVPALCRMAMRGLVLSERQAELLDHVVPGLTVTGRERKAEKEAARKPKVKQIIKDDTLDRALCDIEGMIDDKTIDAGRILRQYSPKPDDIAKITPRFERLVEEVKHALERTDMQCVEAYRGYTKRQLREMLAQYSSIINAFNMYTSAGIRIKAPTIRKIKPKSPEKIVAKLRYLNEYQELSLKSVDPKSLIGATEAIFYNVKSRSLQRYVAADGAKLTVRRTGIEGYDPGVSAKKRLRDPAAMLAKILSGGNKSVGKSFEMIKTKANGINGRVNEDTIILRVIK
jgi:hypothetical protein